MKDKARPAFSYRMRPLGTWDYLSCQKYLDGQLELQRESCLCLMSINDMNPNLSNQENRKTAFQRNFYLLHGPVFSYMMTNGHIQLDGRASKSCSFDKQWLQSDQRSLRKLFTMDLLIFNLINAQRVIDDRKLHSY